MFSGVKTDFGTAGVDQSIVRGDCDREVYENAKLRTIMHWSADAGKKTGTDSNTFSITISLLLLSFNRILKQAIRSSN